MMKLMDEIDGAKDNYLIVSTLQLGFCMTLYVEGRPKPVGLSAFLQCACCLMHCGKDANSDICLEGMFL